MTIANLIANLRTLVADGPRSKIIFSENLGGNPAFPVDGTNGTFRLQNVPVVEGSVYLTNVGTSQRTQAGFTIDPVFGLMVIASPPAANANLMADYNYQWFTDDSYQEFLNQAADNLNQGASPVDPTIVNTGLIPAMMQYALAAFFRARASQYQDRYSSSGGEASQSVESVAKGFATLAEKADKRGDTMRDDFYKSQGQQLKAAFASPRTYRAPGIDPITPPR